MAAVPGGTARRDHLLAITARLPRWTAPISGRARQTSVNRVIGAPVEYGTSPAAEGKG
jgi:hypothetical protein